MTHVNNFDINFQQIFYKCEVRFLRRHFGAKTAISPPELRRKDEMNGGGYICAWLISTENRESVEYQIITCSRLGLLEYLMIKNLVH